jgi:hypothetical protein
MDYAREHIKKYWGITYRRMFGILLVTFAIALAIGVTFTVLTSSMSTLSYTKYLFFWLLLIFITLVAFLVNFFEAHLSTVKLMNDKEHITHYRQMGLWMITIIVGILVFISPFLFVKPYIQPLILLFTMGGVFCVLYFGIALLFKHSYGEFAIGCIAFWALFVLGLVRLSNTQISLPSQSIFIFYFSSMSMMIICSFVGLALIINSSRDSFKDFRASITELNSIKKPRSKRRK